MRTRSARPDDGSVRGYVAIRVLLPAGAAAALACALPGGTAADGRVVAVAPARVVTTQGTVDGLAADGTTAAAIVAATKSTCAQAVIWDVRRAKPTAVDATGCPSQKFVSRHEQVAVGDGMVGVVRGGFDLGGGHTIEHVLSVTPVPTNGRWTDVTGAFNDAYGAGGGDDLSVLGDARVLAFGKWTVCFASDPGDECPGVNSQDQWWVSDPHLVQVRPPGSAGPVARCPGVTGSYGGGDPGALPWAFRAVRTCRKIGEYYEAAALDRGRFVVLPPQGQVTIVRADDGSATELPIPTSTVATSYYGAKLTGLDGADLVFIEEQENGRPVMRVYDASNGTLARSWPVPLSPYVAVDEAQIRLEDVHSGLAVYVLDRTIHVRRLGDGKSAVIKIPGSRDPVHARLENPGLVYSWNVPGKAPNGRIAFVPLARLVAALR